MTQSFNVPDSISFNQLEEHLKTAVPDDCHAESDTEQLTDDLIDQAHYWVTRAAKSSDNPTVLHKLMVVQIIDCLINFHERVHASVVDDEGSTSESAAAWLKDAGKFQAIMNILGTIDCGPDDPMLVKAS